MGSKNSTHRVPLEGTDCHERARRQSALTQWVSAEWMPVQVTERGTWGRSLALASFLRGGNLSCFRVHALVTWLNAWYLLSAQSMFSNSVLIGEDRRLKWRLLRHPSESQKTGVPEKGRHHNYWGQMVGFRESLQRPDRELRGRKGFLKEEGREEKIMKEQNYLQGEMKEHQRNHRCL